MEKILVSACLLGRKVRYDGGDKAFPHPILERWRREGRLVPVCPEVVAGLDTPRPAAEIAGGDGGAVLAGNGRVLESGGGDVTDRYLRGAEIALALAREQGARFALLTDGSPSCGKSFVYDGTFSGRQRSGVGVTTALLEANGVRAFDEGAIETLAGLLD